jgi:hypothetical protein
MLPREGRLQPSGSIRTASISFGYFVPPSGESISCNVLNISSQGMSLRTKGRPPIGEIVNFGCTKGRVVRHHENGIAIQFLGVEETADHKGRAAKPIYTRDNHRGTSFSAVDIVDGASLAIIGVATRADQFSGTVVEVNTRLKRLVTDLKAVVARPEASETLLWC